MKYVDSQPALNEATQAVRRSSWAAVDSEADSLHHYHEKLCLLQISVEEGDFVIDTLTKLDYAEFMNTLAAKPLLLHGADFDLRIMKKTFGFAAREFFDTMIASQILGYEKQGLAELAKRHCDVVLIKKFQTADWSMRPLKQELLDYAAADTHYLKTIYEVMKAELEALGRLEWAKQACARLLKNIAEEESGAKRWHNWQIKGSKHLRGKSLTFLKELWEWREELAQKKDRPPYKVLNSDVIIQIAEWAPQHPGVDVAELPKAPRNVRGELRDELNRLLRKAEHLPIPPLPVKIRDEKRKKADDKAKVILEKLKEARDKISKELALQPGVLVPNHILETLSIERPDSVEGIKKQDLLMPWQLEILAEPFIRIFSENS